MIFISSTVPLNEIPASKESVNQIGFYFQQ